VELIHYAGCSLDPTEIFIMAKMTSVEEVARRGEGNILANFREIPALCRPIAEQVITKLKKAGIGGTYHGGYQRAGVRSLCGPE